MSAVLVPIESQVQNQVCGLVCETIVKIQAYYPDLLQEKYRSIPWGSSRYQEGLVTKLTNILDGVPNWQVLWQRVQKFLGALLIPEAFKHDTINELKAKIIALKTAKNQSESEESTATKQKNSSSEIANPGVSKSEVITQQELSQTSQKYPAENNLTAEAKSTNLNHTSNNPNSHTNINQIQNSILQNTALNTALLVLDAEYLQLTAESEEFLRSICNLPLQEKIAIADWCEWEQPQKFDRELYQRGYDLIHIPEAKLRPENKISAFASLIPTKFPHVQEILLCVPVSVRNADNTLDHLCSHLEQAGLNVFIVTKQEHRLLVGNRQTRQTFTHNIIPSLEQLMTAIAQIINDEGQTTGNQWVHVSKISKIFTRKYQISLDTVVQHHLPGQSISNLLKGKSDFVTHQPNNDTELYITLFKLPTT